MPPPELAIEKNCFVHPEIRCANGIKGRICLSQYYADFSLSPSQLMDLRNDFIEEVPLQVDILNMRMHHVSFPVCFVASHYIIWMLCLQARKGLRGEKSTCLMAPTMVDILPDGWGPAAHYTLRSMIDLCMDSCWTQC